MSATLQAPPADDSSRLTLTLFLALVLHAFVILGVGFESRNESREPRASLDVTWVTAPQTIPADEPVEFLADQDQAASGDALDNELARSPVPDTTGVADPGLPGLPAPLPVPEDPVPALIERTVREVPAAPPETAVTRERASATVAPVPEPEIAPAPQLLERPSAALLVARGVEAARTAPAETETPLSVRASRTLYLDTLGARGAPEAAYLEAWIRKVERIGNLNYPDEARRRGLSGTLVLSVRLNADGDVLQTVVTQSSGEPVLDEAAIRIVDLARPFAPFTDGMRASYDHLVITRTWAFRRGMVERLN